MKRTPKGFGIAGVMVILSAVSVLCVAGWVIYHRQSSNDSTTKSGITVPNPATTTEPSPAPTQEENTTEYLAIKEWGVRIKLAPAIEGATYRFKNPADQWVKVTTPRLAALSQQYSPECAIADDSISITRAKPGDDRFGSPWTEENLQKVATKAGDYYYFSEQGQPCFSNEENFRTPKEINTIRTAFTEAVRTIERE